MAPAITTWPSGAAPGSSSFWARGVTTVLVGGLATDHCVKTSVLQLRRAGFRVIVHLDACRGIALRQSTRPAPG